MDYNWNIAAIDGPDEGKVLNLSPGTVVYVVGANGSGKSALLTTLSVSLPPNEFPITRIAAHRQSWLTSSSVDLTPKARKDIQSQISNRDRRVESRWKDDYAASRAQAALFDLANAQNRVSREVLDHLKAGRDDQAASLAKKPSPIEAMNEILAVSALTVRLSLNEDGDVFAQHGEGTPFSIVKLSDGERNAIMLAAQILTAPTNTLFLIDEPERHLHRSITEPMLTALFERRNDCAFVIATHVPELAASYQDATVVISRKCSWNGDTATGWEVDIVPPDAQIPEGVKEAILGSRKRILFIEGEKQSLDYPLVSALFPELSVTPVGSCREVIRAVTGLLNAAELHWLHPIGLIDRDDRDDAEIESLQEQNIFALEVSSIESLFYSVEAIEDIAGQQATLLGKDAATIKDGAIEAALSCLDETVKATLAARRSERRTRNDVLSKVPEWKTIQANGDEPLSIEVDATFPSEKARIDEFVEGDDYEAIVARYNIKRSPLPDKIARQLEFRDRRQYEEAVVALARRNTDFRNKLIAHVQPVADHLAG